MATTSADSATGGQAEELGREVMEGFEGCRYRRDLAGFHVCWAASGVGIVTDRDCSRCRVPEVLNKVDCYYLQARVQLAPNPTAEWVCGSTGGPVNAGDPADWNPCESCERRSARRSSGEQSSADLR
jgi:hypothetical protein